MDDLKPRTASSRGQIRSCCPHCGSDFCDDPEENSHEFKCLYCGENFTQEEMEAWQSHLEELKLACEKEGVRLPDFRTGLPGWNWKRLAQNRKDLFAGKLSLEEISSLEYWEEHIFRHSTLSVLEKETVCVSW